VSRTFEKFKSFIKRHAMLEGSRGVVVAVSGGPDSVALLDMLVRLRDRQATSASAAKLKIHVAHLDHMLRGSESARDAEFVRQLAGRLGLSSSIGAIDARVEAESSGKGIEEAAREIRYNFLLRAGREADCDRIATGHTMSDQAETVLMRLARGAGLRGLVAMRPVSPAHEFAERITGHDTHPQLIRPLLRMTREEVEEYCRDRHLDFRIDSTNLSRDYARNRMRLDALPALRSINPRAVEAIARAAEIIATDQDALDYMASKSLDRARIKLSSNEAISNAALNNEALDKERATYSVEALLKQPIGIRRRMIIEAINRARAALDRRESDQITSAHIESVEHLLEDSMSGSRVALPGGLVIWREFDALVFDFAVGQVQTVKAACERLLSSEQPRIEAGGFILALERNQPPHLLESLIEQARREGENCGRDWLMAVLDDSALPDRLIIRPRRSGERALVLGQRKTKKLKNLMIDHKIPSSRRRIWPVVTTPDDRYVWSPGLPPALEFAARDETQRLAILRASTVLTGPQELE